MSAIAWWDQQSERDRYTEERKTGSRCCWFCCFVYLTTFSALILPSVLSTWYLLAFKPGTMFVASLFMLQACVCFVPMVFTLDFSMWLKSAFASGIPQSLWTVSGLGFISVEFLCPLGMSSPVKYHSVCCEAFSDSLSCTLLAPLLSLMFLSL